MDSVIQSKPSDLGLEENKKIALDRLSNRNYLR